MIKTLFCRCMLKVNKPMYKVRFHLAKGVNYMKWQVVQIVQPKDIRIFKNSVGYHDPESCQLIMYDCSLNNVSKVAEKIFLGSSKTVCAWISCKDLDVIPSKLGVSVVNLKNVTYNPRISPHWSLDGENIDNKKFSCLLTSNNKVYISGQNDG